MWYPTNKLSIAVAKIAEKDIPIIKVGIRAGSEIFESDFMHAQYKLNEPVPRIRIHPVNVGYIEEGYHFFMQNMVIITKSNIVDYPLVQVRGRFTNTLYHVHHFHKIDSVLTIAKGFVPKGTIYYLNVNGEGVAERIYLTEMIKL